MTKRNIHVTDYDMTRLRKLLEGTQRWNQKDRAYLEHLEEELDRAEAVPSEEDPLHRSHNEFPYLASRTWTQARRW